MPVNSEGRAEPPVVAGEHPATRHQQMYEREALMKLRALRRIAEDNEDDVELVERLKERVIGDLLVQLSAVAQFDPAFEH